MAVLSSTTKIRFQDCDPFNHLNNARYIDYFLNARGDQILESLGIDIYGSQGFSWLVGTNQLAYFRPALLNETVCIESQITEYSSRKLVVEMRMFSEDRSELKALLWVTSIPIVLKTMKMAAHSPELMNMFKDLHSPVDSVYFEERRRAILKCK